MTVSLWSPGLLWFGCLSSTWSIQTGMSLLGSDSVKGSLCLVVLIITLALTARLKVYQNGLLFSILVPQTPFHTAIGRIH